MLFIDMYFFSKFGTLPSIRRAEKVERGGFIVSNDIKFDKNDIVDFVCVCVCVRAFDSVLSCMVCVCVCQSYFLPYYTGCQCICI